MSKTDLFISELVTYYGAIEIEEYEYNTLLIAYKNHTQRYIKDLEIYYNVSNRPFPLFRVKVLRDYQITTNDNGGYDDYLEIAFKHRGKYYYIDLSERM